jgi:hypothetical protein
MQREFSGSHSVKVGTSLMLGEFEHLLGAHFAASLATKTVEFDLRQLEFVGHFPATLLFSWCSAIALKGGRVPEQRRVVAELDALQAEVDALKRLQSETAAELDALLPAVLDRAFKGEL